MLLRSALLLFTFTVLIEIVLVALWVYQQSSGRTLSVPHVALLAAVTMFRRPVSSAIGHIVFVGVDLGLVGFLTGLLLDSAPIKEVSTPILGLTILLAVVVNVMNLRGSDEGGPCLASEAPASAGTMAPRLMPVPPCPRLVPGEPAGIQEAHTLLTVRLHDRSSGRCACDRRSPTGRSCELWRCSGIEVA